MILSLPYYSYDCPVVLKFWLSLNTSSAKKSQAGGQRLTKCRIMRQWKYRQIRNAVAWWCFESKLLSSLHVTARSARSDNGHQVCQKLALHINLTTFGSDRWCETIKGFCHAWDAIDVSRQTVSAYSSFQVPISRIVIISNRCQTILTVTVWLKSDRWCATTWTWDSFIEWQWVSRLFFHLSSGSQATTWLKLCSTFFKILLLITLRQPER